MMAAGGPDDLNLSKEERTCAVVLIRPVETLDHGRVDRRDSRLGRPRVLTGGRAKPSSDTDLEIGRSGRAKKRELNDVRNRKIATMVDTEQRLRAPSARLAICSGRV